MDQHVLEQVTVVCVTHQSRALLDAMAQTLLPLPNVIVVDNASSDGTAAALRERIPHATVLERASNGGFGSANNEAMAQVRTSYALWLNPDGEVRLVDLAAAAATLRERPAMLVHAPVTLRRLGLENLPALDLLELFAFVRPARFCLPTPRGLARALGLPVPADLESEAGMLPGIAGALLAELGDETDLKPHQTRRRRAIASAMAAGGWRWGPAVMEALDGAVRPEALDRVHPTSARAQSALSIWEDLPDWAEHAPEPPPGHVGVDPAEARQRLRGQPRATRCRRPKQLGIRHPSTMAFGSRIITTTWTGSARAPRPGSLTPRGVRKAASVTK